MPFEMLSAAWVLPMAGPPIREGAVVIGRAPDGDRNDDGPRRDGDGDAGRARAGGRAPAGGTVVACGTRAELLRTHPGLPERRARGALLPGLVNAHTHLELSALGSAAGPVPGGAGLIPWTRDLLGLRAARAAASREPGTPAALPPEVERTAAERAARAARAAGTAAIGDVGNGVAGWRALRALGFRGLFFHELVGSRESATGDALADAARERDRAAGDGAGGAEDGARAELDDARLPAVPAPHAPYSVGPDLLRRIFAAARRTGHPTSIHLAEDPAELELLEHGRGPWLAVLAALGLAADERAPHLGPTAYLERLGAFESPAPPLLVHMVHARDADLARTRAAGATIVLCPRSNLHIGGQLPPVPAMHAAGVRLALGTDSLCSVSDLSLWTEITTLAHHFPDLPPALWLGAATRGGAEALGLGPTASPPAGPGGHVARGGHLGALSPGARPGVLDVELAPRAPSTAAEVERALVSNPTPHVTWMVSP
jgi:cytosine/adenosine deaminase-related metal-dependent hydrolase